MSSLQKFSTKRNKVKKELNEDQKTEIKEVPFIHFSENLLHFFSLPLKKAFALFDTDKDNKLDYHELKVAMRALGFDVKKQEVLKILRDFDNEDQGLIDFDDFNKVMTEKILDRDPIEEIKKAFQLFDDDGTGKINLRNLRRVAKEIGEQVDDDELQAMIEEFDLDQDGEINEQEFISIMMDNDDTR
ncbi:Calcium-binding component of the spindle pole body (SPB) half-bridge [Clydaea vesicula]|uniref:Calcium-binding component of the spindle pole body (SPB) half-bridge n=1 Tax=Clydaea vesicula TaxID=447962 RepID=A0AAD5U0S7_9FUNG|nr:Calcium-binding component of the spindle pole body (SPB) half-bridge [Clydaea vesicula]